MSCPNEGSDVSSVSVWFSCVCTCVCARVWRKGGGSAQARGGCGTLCKGGLQAGRALSRAVHLTWAVAPSPCVPGCPRCPSVMEKQSQGVFCSVVHLICPENRAFKPCLSFPSQSHRVRATAFAMHPSGLSPALTLEGPLSLLPPHSLTPGGEGRREPLSPSHLHPRF